MCGRLPVRDRLAGLDLLNAQRNRCHVYGNMGKDICHLFILCRMIGSIWYKVAWFWTFHLCVPTLSMSFLSFAFTWIFHWELFWCGVLLFMFWCGQFGTSVIILPSAKILSMNMLASNYFDITMSGGWKRCWGMLLQLLLISVDARAMWLSPLLGSLPSFTSLGVSL